MDKEASNRPADRPGEDIGRLAGPMDAVLHLLDRQVVDLDGLLAGKVDDLELTEYADGSLVVTGLLLGPAALVPRLGGRLGSALLGAWGRLGLTRAGRLVPGWIGMDRVAALNSEVRLSVPRADVVQPQPPALPGTVKRRLQRLLVCPAFHEGRRCGSVQDLRVAPGESGHLVARSLVVGHGHPGSLLGFDRDRERRPAMVAGPIRWLHRGTRQVDLDGSASIDWDARRVEVTGELRPLLPSR